MESAKLTILTMMVLLSCTLLFQATSAANSVITFFDDVNFGGKQYSMSVTRSQRCYNILCFDNKAASVKWRDLPTTGNFGKGSQIAFFTGPSCTSKHKVWSTSFQSRNVFPSDFNLDGLYHQVTSVIVWQKNNITTDFARAPCTMSST